MAPDNCEVAPVGHKGCGVPKIRFEITSVDHAVGGAADVFDGKACSVRVLVREVLNHVV